MLEAAEPLDRDQHKLARFYMTASSVLKRLMTTHNLLIFSTVRAALSLGGWGPQPGWLPSPKARLPAHPEGQAALRISHLLSMSKRCPLLGTQ